jgi:DNA primase
MHIPREAIAQVRTANDLCEVVREHGIVLTRRGRTHFGLCPFHAERTASFGVSREAGLFHCFGCGAGGDVIRFVERTQHISFPEAVRRLARRAGVTIDTDDTRSDRG